jgi:hypothetical protein
MEGLFSLLLFAGLFFSDDAFWLRRPCRPQRILASGKEVTQ